MTKYRLILRNLLYFRAGNLAVVIGMAVATAVLTGALMVGDSVRGSLRALAVQRLGPVDHALVASRFFDQSLVNRLHDAGLGDRFKFTPAILIRGGVSNFDGSARTGGVQIAAVGPAADGKTWVDVSRRQGIVNGEIADALSLKDANADVLYTVATALDTPRDATLARRGASEVVSGDRIKLSRIENQPGFISLFNLEGSQRVPRNLWLNLADLQRAVEQPKRINSILVQGEGDVAELNAKLRSIITLADYGLALDRTDGKSDAVLNSRGTFIEPTVLEAARSVAGEMNTPLNSVSVYLVNQITIEGPDKSAGKSIHYAVAAGLESFPVAKLADNEIALNAWTADQLGAKMGDAIRLAYYQRKAGGDLRVVESEPLKIAAVIPMQGIGADPTLTPAYKGLTDADSVSDWDPPQGVEIDKSKVTKADEAYWSQYRAAPKIFLNLATAGRLWGGAYGDVTSLRIPADKADDFARLLREKIDPATMGIAFQPIRERQLAAASGGTDFAMLFVGFSFFLIAAAALLIAMLFRLNIEQRARQVGLLAAIGFAPKPLRGLALLEAIILAMIGGAIGLAGAVGYTWLMVAGLRTWWKGAVGTTAMQLYVEPATLVIGFVASLLVALVAIWWSVWRIGRTPEARLLAGGWNDSVESGFVRSRGRWATRLGVAGVLLGVLLLALGGILPQYAKDAFLGGGALLLTSCLLILSGQLRPRRARVTATSLEQLGMRNAARHTARSVLSAGLIAFAAFTLVTVASMKQGEPRNTAEKDSGAGGYRLILQAGIPLTGDLATQSGRELLGLAEPDAEIWNRVKFIFMRKWAGQDVSCLNLTRPDSPTILAVANPESWTGRFTKPSENPWKLLEASAGDPDVVPVIADGETAQYILHLGVGDILETKALDQRGKPLRLKLVGTLAHSIFQSELLMSETNFLRLFPSQGGFGTVLVEASTEDAADVQKRLNTELEGYAVTVDTTAARLATYAEVANTYLSTFQTLGSLGLILGAVGLAVVLLRGLVERRAELALLTAIGFAPTARVKLVLFENAFLLILGLLIGAGCAVVGILPTLLSAHRVMNLPGLAATLAGVLFIGLAGLAIAVWIGQRRITTADLRAE